MLTKLLGSKKSILQELRKIWNISKILNNFFNKYMKLFQNSEIDIYALFNTKLNQIVSRGLTSDIIDYQLYKKNKMKDENLKVIQNPFEDEMSINDNGSLVFKTGHKPQFLGFNY